MIDYMLILEPIKYGSGMNKDTALDNDYLGGENTIMPVANAQSAAGKVWLVHDQKTSDPSGPYVDFTKYFRDYEHSIFYIASYVYMPTTRPIKLLVNSDDGCKIWWNGEMVYRDQNGHGGDRSKNNSVDIEGLAGTNRILVKVRNGSGPTGVRVIIGKSATEEYTDLQYSIVPPVATEIPIQHYTPTVVIEPVTQEPTINPPPTNNQADWAAYYAALIELQNQQNQQQPTQQNQQQPTPPAQTFVPATPASAKGTKPFLDDIADQIGIDKQWLIFGAIAAIIVLLFVL